jgi:hypothetical protein
VADVEDVMCSAESPMKMTVPEINCFVDVMNKRQNKLYIHKSNKKTDKVNKLCQVIGNGTQKTVYVKSLKKLSTMCALIIKSTPVKNSKVSKSLLNDIPAISVFPERTPELERQDTVAKHIRASGIQLPERFSFPEYDEGRQQLEPKCRDGDQLLVNCRMKVCKDGLENIRKEAWI